MEHIDFPVAASCSTLTMVEKEGNFIAENNKNYFYNKCFIISYTKRQQLPDLHRHPA